jgi:multidrug efflux system membrane fusion protein
MTASATANPDKHDQPQRHVGRYVVWGVVIVLIVLGLWWLLHVLFKPKPTPPPPPVPVVTAVAQTRSVPVYLTGLGQAQAYNTVTVHTQINGILQKVAFVEGQHVKAGQLLAQIDPRPLQAQLEQAVATEAKDKAALVEARLDLQRYQTLVSEDSIARQQRDTQAALVLQDAAAVQNDQALIDYAKVQLSYTSIRSPIAGITGVRMVDAGNLVQTADVNGIVVVTHNFDVVNEQMAKGTLTVSASSRDDSKMLGEGTVLLINNQIDPTTGMVKLKATFPNQSHALWPGQFVDAQLLVRNRQDVVTVPAATVQRGPTGTYAYVVKGGNTVEMRTIKVSTDNGGGPTAIIESGIKGGEQVVVDGQLKLHPKSKIKVVPATAPTQ